MFWGVPDRIVFAVVAFKEVSLSCGGGDKNIVFFLDLEPNPETPVCSLDIGFRDGPVAAACTVPNNDNNNKNNSESRKISIGLYRRAMFLTALRLAVRFRPVDVFKSTGYNESYARGSLVMALSRFLG